MTLDFPTVIRNGLLQGRTIYRQSEPHIEYDLDAAEGLRFWSMDAVTDDLLVHSFDASQICATDWLIKVETWDTTVDATFTDRRGVEWPTLSEMVRANVNIREGEEHSMNPPDFYREPDNTGC